jgi:Alkylmercury lyase
VTPAEVAGRLDPLFPPLDELGRAISLDIYRSLARGAPVELSDAAARRAREWPGVYYDGERELYAWCVWDTLFLPAVLGTRIEVASTCRATGEPVRLVVRPDAVEWSEPRELAVSFVVPDSEAVRANVITSFCHHVHFFASKKAQLPPSAFLLPLEQAFHVGQLLNRRRYGAAL